MCSVNVGDRFPACSGDIGFLGKIPDARKSMPDLLKGKKCIVVSLPGAFTPT